MTANEKKVSRRLAPRQVGRMVETVIGCKWSFTVLQLVEREISRPGAMERSVAGLSGKVLNDSAPARPVQGLAEAFVCRDSAAGRVQPD